MIAACGWTEAAEAAIRIIREFKLAEWGPWGCLVVIVAVLLGMFIRAWGTRGRRDSK